MSKSTKELLKKLSKYPKNDIIEALGRQFQSDFIIGNILSDLEHSARKNAIIYHEKAFDTFMQALTEYAKWKNDMCCKYGDGKTVNLSAIPSIEITRGVALERALKEASEAEKKQNDKVNKMLKN